MNIKITVLGRPPEDIETTWEGVTRQKSQQWCTLEIDGLPTAFQMTTERGASIAPGEYALDPKSFGVERGRLQMQRPILVPIKLAAPASSSRPGAST